jgi:hypothetical protein
LFDHWLIGLLLECLPEGREASHFCGFISRRYTFPEISLPMPESPVKIDGIVQRLNCIHEKILQFS